MKKNLLVKIFFIFILAAIAAFISSPWSKYRLKLGLDLSGGSRLTYDVDTTNLNATDREKAINSLRNVLERRVNLFGVSEPNVLTSTFEGKNRVIVELPGVSNPQEAAALLGKTAQLVFSEVKQNPANENATPSASLIPTSLTGADLKSADVVFDRNTGKPSVSIQFNEEGSKKFEDITGKNINQPLAIVLDQNIVSAPVVQEKIVGGKAQISGSFTLEEAKNLEIQLNAGALPVPIKLVEERSVGATLGADSIEKSIKAGFVGIIMVALFMILVYRKNGIIAVIALLIFGIITLAVYKLIPVVLTLPGIAGFLLSVGMAVDSNILIFERLKEEIKKRPIADALEVAFGRAWDSIRDANIATLVTAFILANPLDWSFLHTSGPVRGFAITLALGIGISLFTGVVVSRNLMRLLVNERRIKA